MVRAEIERRLESAEKQNLGLLDEIRNLKAKLAEHLVWAESNSYECPVTLAEDLQEAISGLNDKDKTISNLIENIKCLQPESRWIPCSEKLPKVDRKVLIYDKTVEDPYEGCLMKDGLWTDYDFYISPENVTHWMPLPEPPKGES